MRSSLFIVLLSGILFPAVETAAQENYNFQEDFSEAEYFLMHEEFEEALPFYLGIYSAMPGNSNVAYRIGVCYLHIDGSKHLAIDYLEKASEDLTSSYRERALKQTAAPYDALLYLGDAYRINFRFEEAREVYRRYRATLLPEDTENIAFVDQQLRACENAPVMMSRPVKFTFEPISNIVNDSRDNFYPVVSPDGKAIVYMTSMKFYNAVMFSRIVRGDWVPPVNITPDLHTDGDQYVSCLSVAGGLLLLSRDDNYNSDIWISKFDGVRWSPAVRMKKGINTKYWESHGFITEDGLMLIFASDRPGGYGGLDLWVSMSDERGEWGDPVNMGPAVNTQFNEDRPFLADNGKQLFFTSQGHYNMGGYDIFRSVRKTDGGWSKPENMGYPLNTPDDNIFFCPSENGRGGYISFRRENEGAGKNDIYKVTFK